MPRISHSLLLRARNISPLLPLLLRTCRTLESARNELRWLREHVSGLWRTGLNHRRSFGTLLLHLCKHRGRGVPLQYLLGSQPFGNLNILCRPGVLIPRPETEAYTYCLAKLTQTLGFKDLSGLKVLDLCTGTGCIPLLLYELLEPAFPNIEVLGVDISDTAIRLANENLRHNIAKGLLPTKGCSQVSFLKGDVLSCKLIEEETRIAQSVWDIVVSNPPYISQKGFDKDTQRSVRNWEPKLALVPQSDEIKALEEGQLEDIFYHRILKIAKAANSRVVLMEVGDMEQAVRASRIAIDGGRWESIEIWKDWPDENSGPEDDIQRLMIEGCEITIRGLGDARAVMCRRMP